jgi:predicted nucleotidyltransferase
MIIEEKNDEAPWEDHNSQYNQVICNLQNAFGDRLRAAVLFGSRARRETHENSDHDLFLVIEGLPADPLQRLRQVRTAILDVPIGVNLVVKTPAEVDANLTPLLLDVCIDGICLYGAGYFENYRQKAVNAVKQSGLTRGRIGRQWYWRFDKTPDKEWELTWDGFHELT